MLLQKPSTSIAGLPTHLAPPTPAGQVREKWGSEEAFDAFVRNELPALLETGKRRYFGQPWRVLANAFDALFGFS